MTFTTPLRFCALLALATLTGGCAREADPEAAAVVEEAAAPAPIEATAADEAAVGPSDAAHEATHDPTHGTVTPSVRWPADEPLTRGMRRVRDATTALEQAGREGADPARVKDIAVELKAAVDGMFAECKLAPEADAALHPLLAKVLGASRTLSGGRIDADALADLQAVLDRYDDLFVEAAGNAIPQ